uniref:DUF4493 domain-containing protein n=1 Tax=Alistipes sp. TaxID=1872444 RepID=UPI004056B7E5
MKITKFAAVTLLSALFMIGCGEGHISIDNNNGGGEEVDNKGYLSISSLVLDCRIDETEDPENGGLTTSTSTTRSGVNVNDFLCEIISSDNQTVSSFKFGEKPEGALELLAGDYIFKIQSGEVPGAVWDTPVYGAIKPFKIVRNETTTLSEIVCTLMQIKVTVTYAPDLLERLGETTTTTVSIGENSLKYVLTETRSGFFSAPNASNTIQLQISGTYAADKVNYKAIEMTKEVRDVKVGQHSKIHFFLEQSNEGNINVGVTIRDWVTDEVIPCNVADVVKEEEWKEEEGGGQNPPSTTDDPSIVWEGNDISKRYSLDEVTAVELLINSTKGIKEFVVQIQSDTLTPSELSAVNLCDVLNLCYPDKSYDSTNPGTYVDTEVPLRGFGFAVGDEVIGKNSVRLSITGFLGILKTVSKDGDRHDFVLTVTDSENNTTVKTLKLQSGAVTEDVEDPSIVWEGNDISKRYNLADVTAVELLITSTKGIKEFLVQIKSDTLTPSELSAVNLCDVLNLCYPDKSYDSTNPGTYVNTEVPLRGFGFAVGDEVVGKNSVKLSITGFLGILATVSKDGDRHDFVLTVTDNDNNTTVKTLMLQSGK